MGDIYKEQIIKRKPNTKTTIYRAGLIGAVALVFIVGTFYLGGWGTTLALIAGFGAYFAMGFLYVEYEYTFTSGELDIDIIYNKSRRKRVFSGQVKDFDIMAHVGDKVRMGDFSSAQETVDYSSGVVSDDTYAFLANYKGKRLKVIIEPNEMVFKAIASSLTPRKLFKKV
jgi:hypothetical protein